MTNGQLIVLLSTLDPNAEVVVVTGCKYGEVTSTARIRAAKEIFLLAVADKTSDYKRQPASFIQLS